MVFQKSDFDDRKGQLGVGQGSEVWVGGTLITLVASQQTWPLSPLFATTRSQSYQMVLQDDTMFYHIVPGWSCPNQGNDPVVDRTGRSSHPRPDFISTSDYK